MASTPAAEYKEHWNTMFQRGTPHEWHCGMEDIWGVLEPYLVDDADATRLVVDIGCGASSLGLQVLAALGRREPVLLVDVSPVALEHAMSLSRKASSSDVLQADCRRLPLPSDSVGLVLDKVG